MVLNSRTICAPFSRVLQFSIIPAPFSAEADPQFTFTWFLPLSYQHSIPQNHECQCTGDYKVFTVKKTSYTSRQLPFMLRTDVVGDLCFSLQIRALERSTLKCLHKLICALALESATNTASLWIMRL